ncbi:MAG: SDR family oxidoreductase, partial [Candidatus Dormibacteria bacterium]
MELADRVVIVTGASSGIGAATARLAHDAGARVVLAARRRDRLDALCQSLPGSLAVPTDITRAGDRERLLRRTLEQFGGVDVLVNNAGQGLHVPLLQVSEEDFMAVLALNLVAPLALIQLVVPAMSRRGGGAVVNVSSATSNLVIPG